MRQIIVFMVAFCCSGQCFGLAGEDDSTCAYPIVASAVSVEVGDVVFRDNSNNASFWHMGILWFYDGYAGRYMVIQATGFGVALGWVDWETFLNTANYLGARQHAEHSPPTAFERQEIIYWAKYNWRARFTFLALWGDGPHKNRANSGYQSGDGCFRCDHFVEHVYETVYGSGLRDGVEGDTPMNIWHNGENAVVSIVERPWVVKVWHWGSFGGPIVVEFSELMSRGTIGPENVTLSGSEHGDYAVVVDYESDRLAKRQDLFVDAAGLRHDCKRIIVTAEHEFGDNETMTLRIGGEVRDLGGNRMEMDFVYKFGRGVKTAK